jgi:N-acetylmuramoyl-L-alanine amidase
MNTGRTILGLWLLLLCGGCARKIVATSSEPAPQVNTEIISHGPAVTFKEVTLKDTIAQQGEIIKDPVVTELYTPAGKYLKANRLYFEMIDSMAKVISEYPVRDSSGLPYAVDWVGTPNMGLRRPNYVIIHHTATNNCGETLQEFTSPGGREASAHYVICEDGTVYHMLNDLLRSHHAGESKWGNTTDLNSSSIGIELNNNGYEPFTEPQINSLTILLDRLKSAFKIPGANFIGHGDIAPTRKEDPNWRFPWKELSEKGFGLWWDDTTNINVPGNFDYMMALRIVGYDVSTPASAIIAFKRHFLKDPKKGMTPAAIKVLYSLYRKYYD